MEIKEGWAVYRVDDYTWYYGKSFDACIEEAMKFSDMERDEFYETQEKVEDIDERKIFYVLYEEISHLPKEERDEYLISYREFIEKYLDFSVSSTGKAVYFCSTEW